MVVQRRGGLILLEKISIIPTGNEIYNGVVIDTNSPAIMELVLEEFPQCEITRSKPVIDEENKIIEKIADYVNEGRNLVIIIGGSGGGHRFDPSLSEDYTHGAMLKYLTKHAAREIYGKNGHLWSKIVFGQKNNTMVTNVPGPYVEAVAATKVLINHLRNGTTDNNIICQDMANAVLNNYPSKDGIKCVKI